MATKRKLGYDSSFELARHICTFLKYEKASLNCFVIIKALSIIFFEISYK